MSRAVDPPAVDVQPLPAVRRPRRWLTWLLMLVVFFSGLAIGIGGTSITILNRILDAFHHPEKAPQRIAARLQGKLDLTDEQTVKVEAIVQTRQRELQKIRREVQPRVESQLDQVEQEIAEVLDEAQQAKWHALIRHWREVWIPPLPEQSQTKHTP